jgi:hypothetical protein
MKAVVTLSPEESKRVIAKAVAALPEVRHALSHGIIGLARCTTNAFVAEELIGRPLADRGAYCSGFFTARGACALQGKFQEKLLVLDHGQERWLSYQEGNVAQFIERMDCHDVIIKSGNAIDPEGRVGCLVASPTGGEIGAYLPPILVKGIRFIVPMTLNKTVAVPLERMIAALGASTIDPQRCHGLRCGMIPMPGMVITEVDAFRRLTGAEATPVATGGIGSGAGAVMLVLEGADEAVDAAWQLVAAIRAKGEPPIADPAISCADCYIAQQPGLGNRCSPIDAG